jgi:hypothetical protein
MDASVRKIPSSYVDSFRYRIVYFRLLTILGGRNEAPETEDETGKGQRILSMDSSDLAQFGPRIGMERRRSAGSETQEEKARHREALGNVLWTIRYLIGF